MEPVLEIITKNEAETRKFAALLARELARLKLSHAILVGLEGELGAGKTTFAKGFAEGLGIKEEMKSPTFILMRAFRLGGRTTKFLHFDAYRIEKAEEFLALGFKKMLRDPKNILLVEWSDKIKKILPKKYFRFVFRSPTSNKSRNRTSREIRLYA